MDRIEFEMQPQKRDFEGATMRRMLMSRGFRGYLILFISIFLVLVVLAEINDKPKYENLLSLFGFGCLAALIVPFAIPHKLAKSALKSYYKNGDRLFFLDKERYGVKSATFECYFRWQMFDLICETKNYIFLKRNDGPYFVIFKRPLSDETVSSIKELLAEVPVKKKKFLPNQ